MRVIRSVLDTNVVLASAKSQAAYSPRREVVARWIRGDFEFYYSTDTILEYAEKLLAKGVQESDVMLFLIRLQTLGNLVDIAFFHVRHYPVDPDDVAFLLCAINAPASHLVSYDEHLLLLAPFYGLGMKICPPLAFLEDVRSIQPAAP